MADKINRIDKVEISGLWQRYDLVWHLHPDVNILAGINGSGKTTILNCIYKLIESKENVPDSYTGMVQKVNIDFNNASGIEGLQYVYLDGTYGCVAYPVGIININIISTFDTLLKPLEAVQQLSDKRVNTNLDWGIHQLQTNYLDYQLNISKRKDALLERNNEGFKEEYEKLKYPQSRFLEIIDDLFSETNKKINRDKNQIEFLLGDKEITPYQLSSGEKQLLIILLTVLVQDNKPSILFMDEPEISLHIEWQRKLIKYIRELNPNVQVIIATHSPDIVMDGWMDKVFEVRDLIVKDSALS